MAYPNHALISSSALLAKRNAEDMLGCYRLTRNLGILLQPESPDGPDYIRWLDGFDSKKSLLFEITEAIRECVAWAQATGLKCNPRDPEYVGDCPVLIGISRLGNIPMAKTPGLLDVSIWVSWAAEHCSKRLMEAYGRYHRSSKDICELLGTLRRLSLECRKSNLPD